MNRLEQYNSIVKVLQSNDHNATYDEILEDYSYNLTEAIRILKSCLERIVFEENLEGGELDFYKEQLKRVNNIK